MCVHINKREVKLIFVYTSIFLVRKESLQIDLLLRPRIRGLHEYYIGALVEGALCGVIVLTATEPSLRGVKTIFANYVAIYWITHIYVVGN